MNRKKRTAKAAAVFLVICVCIQIIGLSCFTPDGLESMLPAIIRAAGTDMIFGDNSYTDFYSLKEHCLDADVIIVGVDFSVSESYSFLLDLIVSLKHEMRIDELYISHAIGMQPLFSAVVSAGSDAEMEEAKLQLVQSCSGDGIFCDFAQALYELNKTYPPSRKLKFGALPGESGEDVISACKAAEKYVSENAGQVLLVVSTDLMENKEHYTEYVNSSDLEFRAVRCLYTASADKDDGFRALLVDTDDLSAYDSLFSAATAISGKEMRGKSYSETHFTKFFVMMYNCSTEDIH